MGQIEIIEDFFSPLDRIFRKLRVYLPDSYNIAKTTRYPVIYMLDGQNVYNDYRSAIYDTWQVNKTLDELLRKNELQKPWLVVAIDHLKNREQEYSPWCFTEENINQPLGERFLYTLTDHIIPFIQKRFRTLDEPQNTAIIGSSLGGLMALYCGRTKPNTFGRIGAVSPSLIWCNFKTFEHWNSYIKNLKIYLDMGTEERIYLDKQNIVLDYAQIARDFKQRLQNLGYTTEQLRVVIEKNAIHSEKDWARRFPELAKFLLNDTV